MRSPRLSMAGAVVLLLGASSMAMAEDTTDTSMATVVTGTELPCVDVMLGTRSSTDDGPAPVSYYLGHVAECPTETSDPRVSGTFRTTFNEDCYSMGIRYPCIIWGTNVLEDERGGWDCTYGGTDDMWGENAARVQAVCTGTGGYDGLTSVYHQVFGGVQDLGDGSDIHGIIYEGPPRWGPSAVPPAE